MIEPETCQCWTKKINQSSSILSRRICNYANEQELVLFNKSLGVCRRDRFRGSTNRILVSSGPLSLLRGRVTSSNWSRGKFARGIRDVA